MEKGSDLRTLDDIDLLECLCNSSSEEAYEEFVNRFYHAVAEECALKCKKRNLHHHIGGEIAHETFERVRKYKSFNRAKLNGQEPRKAILGWLYRISSNLFYDHHRSLKSKNHMPDFYLDNLGAELSAVNPDKLLTTKEIAIFIFSKLNKKEQEIVLTDIEHKRGGGKYLPSDIKDSLAERIGVKKESITKMRERAIRKIKQAIDEINK